MKTLAFVVMAVSLFAFGLMGCETQKGQKVGYVNCCVTAKDGSKSCTSMPQGQCTGTIVSDCADCK